MTPPEASQVIADPSSAPRRVFQAIVVLAASGAGDPVAVGDRVAERGLMDGRIRTLEKMSESAETLLHEELFRVVGIMAEVHACEVFCDRFHEWWNEARRVFAEIRRKNPTLGSVLRAEQVELGLIE